MVRYMILVTRVIEAHKASYIIAERLDVCVLIQPAFAVRGTVPSEELEVI